MAIYRGPGGSGDATQDAASEVLLAVQAKEAAQAAQAAAEAAQAAAQLAETNAETAETNAELAETNAETAEANAETAATNAANSASAASTSESNAASSASAASTSASNASTSATNAANSASAASTSATNAAASASTATTQATNASNSASASATSATNASNSASAAATSATNAANSATAAQTAETNAETAETNAAASASAASTSASNAASSASAASTSASNAATSATNASNSASAAATSATNASNSASSASTSATNASNSASAAATSASNAAASYDSFDDRYLGAKSSAPTLDNDGNTLLIGALYFNTTTNEMKVWSGSAWLNAYASLSGALLATNNLSDLNNTATARDNLGVEIGVDVQAYDAQLADIAGLTPSDNNFIVGNGTNFVTESGSTARTSLGLGSIATQDSSNVTVTGGSINGTTVGATTASTGKFTTLEATGVTTVQAGTVSAPAITTSGDTNTGIFFPAADTIAFAEGGVESMRIDSSGNVQIGTTTTATAAAALTLYKAGGVELFLQNSTTGTGSNGFRLLANGNDAYLTNKEAGVMIFETSDTERMRITSGGNLLVGTTTNNASGGVIQVSNGITFPATQSASSDANTLDDYEEGTWTPVIDSDTPGTGRVTTVSSANYTKIGNMVYVQCYITLTTLGSGGGASLVLRGLPFTARTSEYYASLSVSYALGLNANLSSIGMYVAVNSTRAYFNGASAASASPLDNLAFSTYAKAGMSFIIAGCYQTT